MGESKAFTTLFNLQDNFTAKFDAIQKRINAITNSVHKIDFGLGNNILGQTNAIGQNIDGITKSTNAWANTALGKTAKASEETSQKSATALDKIKSKLDSVGGYADKLKDKFGALTGALASGAVAGMAWLKASDSASISDSIYRKLERKHADTKRLQEFVSGASGLGYTTGGQRLDIADVVFGRTRMKGDKAENFVQGIEKLYFREGAYLNRMGISSSADLADLLTKKNLSKTEKQLLADIGIKGGSVGSRARSVAKATEGVTEEDLIKGDPLTAFNNRLGEFSKNMGKTMMGPMTTILTGINKVLDVVNSIPGAPGLVTLAMVLVSAATGASVLVTVLSPLIAAYAALKGAMLGHAAATAVSSAATGANVAVTNASYLSRLKLTAATIYGSVVTKAAAVGQWLLNVAMMASPLVFIIAPLIVLAGALYLVERKTHIFSNALKRLRSGEVGSDLKEFFSSLGGRISGAIGWVERLYGKLKATGLLRFMAGAALGPIGLLGAAGTSDDVREKIWVGMMSLLNWVRTSFPFLSKIHEVIKKVHSIFEWIYSLWQGFWSWIKSAIPGAAKEDARSRMERVATKEHIYLGSDNEWYKLDQDEKGKYTVKSGMRASLFGIEPSETLQKIKAQYDSLPGFADGIAEAVKKGISSIGDDIAGKIAGALQPLIDKLNGFIDSIQTKLNSMGIGTNGINSDEDKANAEAARGFASDQMKTKWGVERVNGYYPTTTPPAEAGSPNWQALENNYYNEKYAELTNQAGQHAVGATFTKSGMFRGNVHAPEEIIPQAIATKGPGPIARALEAFYGATAGQRDSSGSAANQPIEVHLHTSNDFSGMRVNSAIDIEKLMRDIDRRIETGSVAAVQNVIGQRRT